MKRPETNQPVTRSSATAPKIVGHLHLFPATGLAAILAAAGCVSAPPLANEVGSIDVAVQSIGTFDNYVDTLQPTFVLTSDAALQKAIPVTQLSDVETIRSFAASLRLALPTLSVNRQSVTTTSDGTSSDTNTTTRSSGSTSLKDLPSPPAAAAPTITPLSIPVGTQPGVDSLLQYRAATALLQEVALLSSYVRDAAVRRGSSPYVVRLLLTVFPARHDTPYDAYTLISFVAPAPSKGTIPSLINANYLHLPQEDQNAIEKMLATVMPPVGDIPIEVVPLFVTDAVESSFRSSSSANSRGYDASLGGGIAGATATAGFASQATDKASSLGQALNGTQTLARPASNVIVVRLGASYLGSSFTLLPRTYSVTVLLLVPTAASNPTLLNAYILGQTAADLSKVVGSFKLKHQRPNAPAPEDSNAPAREPESPPVNPPSPKTDLQYFATRTLPRTLIKYTAASEFVHVDTGKHACPPDTLELQRRIRQEWNTTHPFSVTADGLSSAAHPAGEIPDMRAPQTEGYTATPTDTKRVERRADLDRETLVALIDAVLDLDYTTFATQWGPRAAARAWPRMVSLAQASGYSGGTFTVPPVLFVFPSDDDLTGHVLQDNGDMMTLSLAGFFGLASSGDLDAVLTVSWKDGKDGPGIVIRNTSTAMTPDKRGATLTFPSLIPLAPLCEADVNAKDNASALGLPLGGSKAVKVKGGGGDVAGAQIPRAATAAKVACGVKMVTMFLSYTQHSLNSLFNDVANPPWWKTDRPDIAVNYARIQKPKSTISVTMQSPRIVADDEGKGEVTIELHSKDDSESAKLVVEGADIVGIVGVVTNKGADRIVTAGQRLTVQLENLAPGVQIRVHVQSTDGKTEASGSPANVVAIARPAGERRKTRS
jgi:hypothetical protein